MGDKKEIQIMSGDDAQLKILTTQDILSAPDLREETVFVPMWNGSVRIRALTRQQHSKMRKQATVKGEIDQDRFELLTFMTGVIEPVFTLDMAGAVQEKAAGAFAFVIYKILELSGLTDDAIKGVEQELQF